MRPPTTWSRLTRADTNMTKGTKATWEAGGRELVPGQFASLLARG